MGIIFMNVQNEVVGGGLLKGERGQWRLGGNWGKGERGMRRFRESGSQ